MASSPERPAPVEKKKYVKAIGPRLRVLLYVVFGFVALLAANSLYLGSITFLEYSTGKTYQDLFYLYMFALHLALGILLIVPYLIFGIIHLLNTRNRKNKRAIYVGYALFFAGIGVLLSGAFLTRVEGFDLVGMIPFQRSRQVVYWLHVLLPLGTIWLYCLHRLAGPKIKWNVGIAYGAAVAAIVALMVAARYQDPRQWYAKGSVEGKKYFEPSLASTVTGDFIPARTLMMNDYCLKCHEDSYKGWFHSSHRFSSFNNPMYLQSVKETREVSLKRDGNVKASRWCAGCHDPVPFFSGKFDDPNYDIAKDSTAHAGITCTVCHAITNCNSTKGNADYVIEEPLHYPFAYSDNSLLQFVNNQLVKAKPEFHKKTFLKPFHKTAEFCSTCHKVHLPYALNHYKEFLRGQNHYDSYLLSGVSGHGARSFYYPDKATTNCSGCHMPLKVAGNDFGAKFFDGAKEKSVHNHIFPGANTGLAWLIESEEAMKAHQEFMKAKTRVDIFGIKVGGDISDPLVAPLRPQSLVLKPGQTYLFETVVRTLKVGHHLTQGTVDSNELWVEMIASADGKVIGRSGALDPKGEVDRYSHFINVFMLDRDGNRINRRNPQDIFVPLYNKQVPPGAGQVVHYKLQVPDWVNSPITLELKLQYRKFDQEYMDFAIRKHKEVEPPIRGHIPGEEDKYGNPLPISTLASDKIVLAVEGGPEVEEQPKSEIPPWQRWNDYGIGLFLEGGPDRGGEFRQAIEAFAEVEKLGRYDGPLNAARVLFREGRLEEATEAIDRALRHDNPPAPTWTAAWFLGLIKRQQGKLDEAIEDFRSIVDKDRRTKEMIDRGFDFSLDYEVQNELGATYFDRAKRATGPDRADERKQFLELALERYKITDSLDPENVNAHFNMALLYDQLGQPELAQQHRASHQRYKLDENARDDAIAAARKKYPAADAAMEIIVRYDLRRPGAPGLAESESNPKTSAESEKSPTKENEQARIGENHTEARGG